MANCENCKNRIGCENYAPKSTTACEHYAEEVQQLKPCPFCGGEPYYRKPEHLNKTAFDVMRIECKKCGAAPYAVEVYEGKTESEKRETIARFWNRRANDE
jgi:Lar family restriction alleviation protein